MSRVWGPNLVTVWMVGNRNHCGLGAGCSRIMVLSLLGVARSPSETPLSPTVDPSPRHGNTKPWEYKTSLEPGGASGVSHREFWMAVLGGLGFCSWLFIGSPQSLGKVLGAFCVFHSGTLCREGRLAVLDQSSGSWPFLPSWPGTLSLSCPGSSLSGGDFGYSGLT